MGLDYIKNYMGLKYFKHWQADRMFSDDEAAAFFGLDVGRWREVKLAPEKIPSHVLYSLIVKAGGLRQDEEPALDFGLTPSGRALIEANRSEEIEVSAYERRKIGNPDLAAGAQ